MPNTLDADAMPPGAATMQPTTPSAKKQYTEAEHASVQMLNPFVHKLELETSADKIKVCYKYVRAAAQLLIN